MELAVDDQRLFGLVYDAHLPRDWDESKTIDYFARADVRVTASLKCIINITSGPRQESQCRLLQGYGLLKGTWLQP